MSDQFEKLIRDSAPEIPDPGEYRRLNRVALRERLHEMEKPKRSHSLVVATACLALMVLFSGQLSNLGSDGWDLIQGEYPGVDGEPVKRFADPNNSFSLVGAENLREAQDIQQAFVARDAEPVRVTCLAYAGLAYWNVYGLAEIDGQIQESSMDLTGILPKENLPRMAEFYENHFSELMKLSKTQAPDSTARLVIFGVEFELESWTATFPEFGEVTFSRGVPRE